MGLYGNLAPRDSQLLTFQLLPMRQRVFHQTPCFPPDPVFTAPWDPVPRTPYPVPRTRGPRPRGFHLAKAIL